MFPWWVQPKKPSAEGDIMRDGVFDYKKSPSLHHPSSPVHSNSSPDNRWHVTSRKQSKKRMKNVKVESKSNHSLLMSHSSAKISSIGLSNSQAHFKPERVHSKCTDSGCRDMPGTKIINPKESATIIPHSSIVKYLARRAASTNTKEAKEAAHCKRSTASYDHCQPQCLPTRSSMKLKESSKERKSSNFKSENKSRPGLSGHELHISKAISHTQSLFKHPVEYKSDNSNGMYPSVDLSALEGIPWQSHNHSKRISPEISSSSLPPLSEKEGTAASNLSFSLQAHSLNITTKYPRILNTCMGRKMVGLSDRPMNNVIAGYPDPFIDGSPKYHQRLIELLGLVSDTMRNESRCKSKCKNFI